MTDRDDLPRSRPPTTADTVASMNAELIRARARIDDLEKQLEDTRELAAAKGIAAANSADALEAMTADRDGLLLGLAAVTVDRDRLDAMLPDSERLNAMRQVSSKQLRTTDGAEPIPMLLHCPFCRARHIDVGTFATKPHHTHACQECGSVWRPAVVHTVGVQFLPGFKDKPTEADLRAPCNDPSCPCCAPRGTP